MKIAVVGCGIAGSTVAWQLAEQGFAVTLFEQAPRCGPVGAGILMQPSGQRLLARLGLLDTLTQSSSRIDSLRAQHRSGRVLVELKYAKLGNDFFGLGVLRSDLFALLLDRCLSAGVELREGVRIKSFEQDSDSVALWQADGTKVGGYDYVIAADGSRSELRKASGLTRSIREYREAALWITGPCRSETNRLLQLVDKTGRLVGILPLGQDRCSFFWGIGRQEKAQVWSRSLDDWKRQVVAFLPVAEEILGELKSFDQIAYATYRNVRMKQCHLGRVVFIGDAAHATSPHLGQGANLALADAVCLADEFARAQQADGDFESAIRRYALARKSTTQYYSQLTGWLTPFFQTDHRWKQLGRNLALPVMPHLPIIGKQMVLTLAGLKRGWLSFRPER